MALRSFTTSTTVPAPRGEVWARVTTAAGINGEMMPVMSMTMPAAHRGSALSSVPVGVPLGRAWIRLLGVLPVDFDALTVVEVEAGRHFRERSWMLSMRRWEHDRTLTDVPGGTRVTDRVGFEPRLPLAHHLLARLLPAFFAHRHRPLRRYFEAT